MILGGPVPTGSIGHRDVKAPDPVGPKLPLHPVYTPPPAPVISAGDISKILGSTGSGAGAGGKAATYTPGALKNVAKNDPNLDFLAAQTKARIANPEGSTKRAIDRAGAAIRDLGEGQKGELEAYFSEHGASGSGGEAAAMQRLAENTAGQVAGKAADISLGRESANDAFLLGSAGNLGAAGAANRADRSLGLQEYVATEEAKRAAAAQALAQQSAVLQLLGGIFGGL